MSALARQIVDSYGALIDVREGDWLGASGPAALTLGFERSVVGAPGAPADQLMRITNAGATFTPIKS